MWVGVCSYEKQRFVGKCRILVQTTGIKVRSDRKPEIQLFVKIKSQAVMWKF